MTILPTATVERLIRSAGAYRVSEAAARELAEVLDEIGKNLSKDAMALAKHDKRRTIKAEDIKLAVKLKEVKIKEIL
ncbi:histone [Candidatus Altiarchaeales archaeon WOR_SM1_SCG]|nr:histone [Candidatus Altiarchaeales archaeon WOR_SM1_SCG]